MDKMQIHRFFLLVFTTFATVAPLLLVCFAFQAASDSADRARIVLEGCEQIVALLAMGLALHGAYRSGLRKGLADPSAPAFFPAREPSAGAQGFRGQPG